MSDKRKYRITVSLQQTEFEVDAVDDCDAEEQVNRIMLDGYDIWQFDDIELVDEEDQNTTFIQTYCIG